MVSWRCGARLKTCFLYFLSQAASLNTNLEGVSLKSKRDNRGRPDERDHFHEFQSSRGVSKEREAYWKKGAMRGGYRIFWKIGNATNLFVAAAVEDLQNLLRELLENWRKNFNEERRGKERGDWAIPRGICVHNVGGNETRNKEKTEKKRGRRRSCGGLRSSVVGGPAQGNPGVPEL